MTRESDEVVLRTLREEKAIAVERMLLLETSPRADGADRVAAADSDLGEAMIEVRTQLEQLDRLIRQHETEAI